MDYKFNQLRDDLTSDQYHGVTGTYSSSQLKTMNEDPEVFHKKYITKELERETAAAFDVGTYFHTATLEPHKLELECAVYEGKVRNGKAWDDFEAKHKGKAIITVKERTVAENMVSAVKKSPVAMGFLNNSKPELSLFVQIFVLDGEVYSLMGQDRSQVVMLTSMGWVPTDDITLEELEFAAVPLIIKVRADALGEDGVISDLKSTTGGVSNKREIAKKVNEYDYDLSAALYLDIFSLSGTEYHTFVWIFASKTTGMSRSWKASDRDIMIGRAKWRHAVLRLADCITENWSFPDKLEETEPMHHNLEWLKEA